MRRDHSLQELLARTLRLMPQFWVGGKCLTAITVSWHHYCIEPFLREHSSFVLLNRAASQSANDTVLTGKELRDVSGPCKCLWDTALWCFFDKGG